MKQSITFSQFCDSFSNSYKNKFSYEGKRALFDYLESYEDETGEEIELDPVALCCEYSEYENFEELQKNYDVESIEELQDKTQFIPIYNNDGTESEKFIIQDY